MWRQTDESSVRGAGGELVATETVTVVRVAYDGREVASYAGMQRHGLSGVLEASRGTVGVSLSSDRQQLMLADADGRTRLVGVASLLEGSAPQSEGAPLAAPRSASTTGAVGAVDAVGGAGAAEGHRGANPNPNPNPDPNPKPNPNHPNPRGCRPSDGNTAVRALGDGAAQDGARPRAARRARPRGGGAALTLTPTLTLTLTPNPNPSP